MDIKRLVNELIKKFKTNNPKEIAEALNIDIIYSRLGEVYGCFFTYKRSRFIHINSDLNPVQQNFVIAHELGHALLHPKVNTPFLRANTFLSIEKIERQANTFAVEMLLPDYMLLKSEGMSIYQLAQMLQVPQKLIEIKFCKRL